MLPGINYAVARMREMQDYPTVKTGLDHLNSILLGSANYQARSTQELHRHKCECAMIGTALSALYQAGTCHRGCRGGPHVFESLCARSYNLGCSAYLLAMSGYYDESASLIRSLGEIGNLISLSVCDKANFRQWLNSDHAIRMRQFTPAKIRKLIKNQKGVLIADDAWYSHFCEAYTHVTPITKAKVHTAGTAGYAGGPFQSDGLSRMLGELATVLGAISMFISKYAKFDDLLADLFATLEAARGNRGDECAI
jgi:hypothetical protein